MKLADRVAARVIAFSMLASVALIVKQDVAQVSAKSVTQVVNGHRAVAGEVLVKFRRSLASHEHRHLDYQTDADRDREIGGIGIRRLHSRSYDTSTLLAFLRTHPDVVYAEPNYIVETTAVPNDQFFTWGQLWGLLNTGQTVLDATGLPGADIKAPSAWDVSIGSAANVVAVLDTGIDYTHPDLAANVWSAPMPFSVTIGGQTITCAAGTHGFNAITSSCDPLDDHSHGSHVSGTIGAVGNNGIGIVGVNWIASIMGAKFLDSRGTGTIADAINAIEFVIQASAVTGTNVRVLSNSWGGGAFSQALLDEINKANASNMLFVAAAGNTNSGGLNNDLFPHYPASYAAPNVIAVAATDNTDRLASFSNYGPSSVHLGAPGVYVLSTTRNNGYQYWSGTSMATPHVSGAAALVLSHCSLDTAALKSKLLNTVDPIPSLAGFTVTGGRLNVNNAIRACSAPPPDFGLTASPSTQTMTAGASTSYSATVTPTGGFSGTVSFGVSGLPSGVTASFNPPSVTSSGSSTMTITSAPTVAPGSFSMTITGTSGSLAHTANVSLTVLQPRIELAVDQIVSSDGSGTRSLSFTTSEPRETLIVFAASDGPAGGGQTLTVTGGGLVWSLVKRVNQQAGTAEIWKAFTPTMLSNVTVTCTQAFPSFDQSLTVVTFSGAAGTGAAGESSGQDGLPTVSLTTTQPGSLVYAVGNDWDAAVPRTVGAGQVMVHEWVNSAVGNAFWVQGVTGPIEAAGTPVQIYNTSPTTNRWNFAAVEIVPAGSLVNVPDVMGLEEEAATETLNNAGLAVGAVTAVSSTTVPAGLTISQDPLAGTPVLVGSAVAIVVSSGTPLLGTAAPTTDRWNFTAVEIVP